MSPVLFNDFVYEAVIRSGHHTAQWAQRFIRWQMATERKRFIRGVNIIMVMIWQFKAWVCSYADALMLNVIHIFWIFYEWKCILIHFIFCVTQKDTNDCRRSFCNGQELLWKAWEVRHDDGCVGRWESWWVEALFLSMPDCISSLVLFEAFCSAFKE